MASPYNYYLMKVMNFLMFYYYNNYELNICFCQVALGTLYLFLPLPKFPDNTIITRLWNPDEVFYIL